MQIHCKRKEQMLRFNEPRNSETIILNNTDFFSGFEKKKIVEG